MNEYNSQMMGQDLKNGIRCHLNITHMEHNTVGQIQIKLDQYEWETPSEWANGHGKNRGNVIEAIDRGWPSAPQDVLIIKTKGRTIRLIKVSGS